MNPIKSKVAPVIHSYLPPHMIYIGTSEADANPVREGEWLFPAWCTMVTPPAYGKNQCAVFDGEKWLVVPDYRGHRYWMPNGEGFEIVAIGVEPPFGALSEPPAPTEPEAEPALELTVEELRANAYADPADGSDRLFAEAMRMQMTNEIGYETVRDKAAARYEEIRASFPKR